MSEQKRLVSFRDLAKAKPQTKEQQDVSSSEPSLKASAERSVEGFTEQAAERPDEAFTILSTNATVNTSAVRTAARLTESTANLATEATAIPAYKPSAIPPAERSLVAYPEASTKVSEGKAEPYLTLEATHSGSEQKLYGFLYRETISKGKRVFQATQPYLRQKTGISGPNTLRRAIRGLNDKLSIRVLTDSTGDRAGTEYYVFQPKEIIAARRDAGIEIHPITKDIRKRAAEASAIPSVDAFRKRLTSASMGGISEASLNTSERDRPKPSETALHNKYNINSLSPNKASSVPTSDDEKLSQVRDLFNRLAGGGNWKDERDLKSFSEISHVPTWHIILGLCYSVGKSPEHKMSSLAYAVPSILDHYRDMNIFPQSEMIEIAYRTTRKTLLALQTGKWTIPDWESGKE